jgi:hypothetical protein
MRKTFRRNSGEVFHGNTYRGRILHINNYEQAKARYESVKPIGGIRGKLGADIRPVSDRYRTWEVFMKDGDNYGVGFCASYISYDQVKQPDGSTKSIPKSINGTPKPLLRFTPDNTVVYTAQWAGSYTTWDFVAAVLPDAMRFAKFGSKQYMELAQPDGSFQYFLLPVSTGASVRFVPYESDGKRFYRMHEEDIVVEDKYLIDRDKAKQMTGEFKAFIEYYRVMGDLLNAGVDATDLSWRDRSEADKVLNDSEWLWREDGEEYGAKWADAVVAFFKLNTKVRRSWDSQTGNWGLSTIDYGSAQHLEEMSRARLIKMIRPYRRVKAPVGIGFRPDGRHL